MRIISAFRFVVSFFSPFLFFICIYCWQRMGGRGTKWHPIIGPSLKPQWICERKKQMSKIEVPKINTNNKSKWSAITSLKETLTSLFSGCRPHYLRFSETENLLSLFSEQRRFCSHTWLTGGRRTESDWLSSLSTTLRCPAWLCHSSLAAPTLEDFTTHILWWGSAAAPAGLE